MLTKCSGDSSKSNHTIPNTPCKQKPNKIYLDFLATTPLDPRVLDSMLPYFTSVYGNAHSRTHSFGWNAEYGVENARKQIASLIGCEDKEIIFCSGATEATNLAIKGYISFLEENLKNEKSEGGKINEFEKNTNSGYKKMDKKNFHIITTQTEHKCVLDTLRNLEENGVEVTYLPVKPDGLIDIDLLKSNIKENTVMIAVMGVNNEIGVVQPLKEIGNVAKERGVVFFCDAAQAVGKIPIDVKEMNIGMLSISGHKIYGPKGVGALYVRRNPRIRISPIITGGGQERGLRSGTVPVPLVVGLGRAAEICASEMKRDYNRVLGFANRLLNRLKPTGCIRNGGGYDGCVNISFPHVEGEALLMKTNDIALSSGSACTSASLEPSYVLRALGKPEDIAHSSIRFGMGRFTNLSEIKTVADAVKSGVIELKELSPLHEMAENGIDINSIEWGEK